MKLEKILGMEAGLELDRLVAFNLFGYGTPSNVPYGVKPYIRYKATSEIVDGKADCEEILPMKLKNYSRDIAAAWRIVPQMQTLGFEFKIEISPRYPDIFAIFYRVSEYGQTLPCGSAKTAMLAICRAALIAIFRERGELEE